MSYQRWITCGLVGMGIAATAASADTLDVPHTFSAGDPAVAAEVNANFAAVKVSVDDNNSKIDGLSSKVTALEQDTTTSDDVASLQAQIALLESRLAALESAGGVDPDGPLAVLNEMEPEHATQLAAVLPHLELVELSIGGGLTRKTVRFSGVNLQIVDGSGATNGKPNFPDSEFGTTDGLGNLLIGYNEGENDPDDRLGAHNLLMGSKNRYGKGTFGAFIAGRENFADAPHAMLLGGKESQVLDPYGATLGADQGLVDGSHGVVVSGLQCKTVDSYGVALGGFRSQVESSYGAVLGGNENRVNAQYGTVTGGNQNRASGDYSTVSGGSGRNVNGIFNWRAGSLFEVD